MQGAQQHHRINRPKEGGIYYIFFAICMVVFVGMCLLVFGAGYLMLNKSKLQGVADTAAMLAVQRFAAMPAADLQTTPSLVPRNFATRANDALTAVNDYIGANKLRGQKSPLNAITFNASASGPGYMEFGRWVAEASNANPCGAKGLPCFVPNPTSPLTTSDATRVNALRLVVQTPESNRILVPFLKAMSKMTGGSSDGYMQMKAESIALIEEKCAAFLLDVSAPLSVRDTHAFSPEPSLGDPDPLKDPPIPSRRVLDPREGSLFAYSAEALRGDVNCNKDPTDTIPRYWCTMKDARPPAGSVDLHYRSDFSKNAINTGRGKFYVDKRTRAEPLGTFLRALNSVFRDLGQYSYRGDNYVFLAFDRDIVMRYPETGFTNDVGYLAQITNYDNIGRLDDNGNLKTAEQHPNFLDAGLFPDHRVLGTNLPLALRQGIAALAQCPINSRRQLIIASQGVYDYDIGVDGTINKITRYCDPVAKPGVCSAGGGPAGADGGTFLWSLQNRLLRTSGTYDPTNPLQSSILESLRSLNIATTTILAGKHVDPNQCNWKRGNAGAGFLSVAEGVNGKYNNGLDPKDCDVVTEFQRTSTTASTNMFDISAQYPLGLGLYTVPPYTTDSCRDVDNISPRPTNDDYAAAGYPANCAYKFLWKTGASPVPEENIYLRIANGYIGQLAISSMGEVCSLPPVRGQQCVKNAAGVNVCTDAPCDADNPQGFQSCVSKYYCDHDGRPDTPPILKDGVTYSNAKPNPNACTPSVRFNNGTERWSVEGADPGSRAAGCVRRVFDTFPIGLANVQGSLNQ